MPSRDAERGESMGLLSKDKLLKKLGSSNYAEKKMGYCRPETPVGGIPGNPMFWTTLQLSVRLTVLAMLLGTLVWQPDVAASLGMTRFSKFSALAVCLMIFMSAYSVGGVINSASAGVTGCFMACLNIFLLRGFYPDGVTPGTPGNMIPFAAIIGWVDLGLFNLYMLAGNFRMGFRITGMALNTGFMLCFLNPLDQTVFSKNFQINPNGAAVSAFIGTCFGALAAVLAVMLPYPLTFATANMKANAKSTSEDICKLFCQSVEYFCGHCATVLIDRQIANGELLKGRIGSLGGDIGDAYMEAFDASTQGTVRALFEKHAAMLGKIYDILDALQVAMSSEDFGPSHVTCMEKIGASAQLVVDEASTLLCYATSFSDDGLIDADEKDLLGDGEKKVKEAIAQLSKDFHAVRITFDKPVCQELMNEAFFVFCISAFGRNVCEYANILAEDPPKGAPFFGELLAAIKGVFKPPLPHHFRVASRYWWSLMICFMFSVFIDNFNGACATTAVFLINTRVGPDVMAMIQGLLSVVVGVVFNALMYSFSCRWGNTTVLMSLSAFYWCGTIFIAKGSSSLAGVGLMMAALAPFAIVVQCPAEITAASEAAKAVGLWGSIRALLIAVVLTVLLEIAHIPGIFTKLTCDALDDAFEGVKQAFTEVFAEKDVSVALDRVAAGAASAEEFNTASMMEPRLWMCPWKKEFLMSTTAQLKKVRADILVIRLALLGADGKVGDIFTTLGKVPESRDIQMDLQHTIEDARQLSLAVLQHTAGKFHALEMLKSVDGLDELDGLDTALDALAKIAEFPKEAPATMESDPLVQMSIVFVMFEYLISHVSAITKEAVRLC